LNNLIANYCKVGLTFFATFKSEQSVSEFEKQEQLMNSDKSDTMEQVASR
jgi:hypothetical protein